MRARQHAFLTIYVPSATASWRTAKRDSKLTYLTAWIASFVRVPCR